MTDAAEANADKTVAAQGERSETEGKDLDALLDELSSDDAGSQKPEKKETQSEAEIEERVMRRVQAATNAKQDFEKSVGTFAKATGLSEGRAYKILEAEVLADERYARAWQMRHTKPEAWAKVSKTITDDYVKEIGGARDRNTTGDRESAAAAARTKTRTADGEWPKGWKDMSQEDKRKYIINGQAPR